MSYEDPCTEVLRWLHTSLTDFSRDAFPQAEVCSHIAGCARCRGELLLLYAAAVGMLPAPIDCEACRAEIPRLVERDVMGEAVGQSDDPSLWWHLATCPDCGGVYDQTRILVAALRTGLMPAPPEASRPRSTPPAWTLLHLTRQFLHSALGADLYGTARGDGERIILVDETHEPFRRVILAVQELPDRSWQVVVTILPPPKGSLVLGLSDQVFRARFDSHGVAHVDRVPALLLTDPFGPDLAVGLELDLEG